MKRLFSLFLAIVLVISASVVQFAPVNAVTTDTVEKVESLNVNDTTTETEATSESVADENSIAPLAEGGTTTAPVIQPATAPTAVTSLPEGVTTEWKLDSETNNMPHNGSYILSGSIPISGSVEIAAGETLKLYATSDATIFRTLQEGASTTDQPTFKVFPGGSLEIIGVGSARVLIDGGEIANPSGGIKSQAPLVALLHSEPGTVTTPGHTLLTNVDFKHVHMNPSKYTYYGEHDYNGGGINIAGEQEYVELNNCKFENFDGGEANGEYSDIIDKEATSAIYVDANFRATDDSKGVSINNTIFDACYSYEGGAIRSNCEFDTVYINGCVFTRCQAEERGGAVYGTDVSKIVINSITDGTTTKATQFGYTGDNAYAFSNIAKFGGAVNSAGTITIANNTFFTYNRTKINDEKDGILVSVGDSGKQFAEIPVKKEVNYSGGAIFLNETAKATIINSIVSNNFAESFGGGICSLGELEIYNSNITGNRTAMQEVVQGKLGDLSSAWDDNSTYRNHQVRAYQFYAYSGGGMMLENKATISGCTISENETTWTGGGIAFSSGDFTIDGGTVISKNTVMLQQINPNETTTNAATGHGLGGGVAAFQGANITVNDAYFGDPDAVPGEVTTQSFSHYCYFINNLGNAQYTNISYDRPSTISLTNVTTDKPDGTGKYGYVATPTSGGNIATHGGAIYAYENTNIQINKAEFNYNVADTFEFTVNFGYTDYPNGCVKDADAGCTGKGGAIYTAGDLTINENVEFIGNYAADFGGAVFQTSADDNGTPESTDTVAKLLVQDSDTTNNVQPTFMYNVVNEYSGGAICTWGTEGYVNATINNSLITDNKIIKSGYGGGICIGAVVTGNYTVYKNVGNINNCTITNNIGGSGGGVQVHVGSSLSIDNTTISGNTAKTLGGGVFANRDSNISISNSVINGNTVTTNGAGIYTSAHLAEISNTEIYSNTGAVDGGGVYVSGSVNTYATSPVSYIPAATISDTEIYNHNVTSDGGGIYNEGTLTMNTANVHNNTATEYGGGIFTTTGLTDTKSTISTNTAINEGGGIAFRPTSTTTSTATMSLDGTKILSNTAETSSGGGVSFYYSSSVPGPITIANAEISGNTAQKHAGGAYIQDIASMTISNSTITNNTATVNCGGGLALLGCPDVTITDTRIDYNEALSAGNESSSVVSGYNGNGGGIYAATLTNRNTLIKINGGSVSYNKSLRGAGLFSRGGNSTYTSKIIVSGTSETDTTGKCTVINENEATYAGGGVALYNYGYFYLRKGEYNGKTNITGLHNNYAGGNNFTDSSRLGDDIYSNNYSFAYIPSGKNYLSNNNTAYWYEDWLGTNNPRFRNNGTNQTKFGSRADHFSVPASDDNNSFSSEYYRNSGKTGGPAITLGNPMGVINVTIDFKDVFNEKYEENTSNVYKVELYSDSTKLEEASLSYGGTVTFDELNPESYNVVLTTAEGVVYIKKVTCIADGENLSVTHGEPGKYQNVLDYVTSSTSSATVIRNSATDVNFTNIVYGARVHVKYYPRKSENNKPADIMDEPLESMEKFVGQAYINALANPDTNQALSLENTFKYMIINSGLATHEKFGLNNLVDDYKFFGSQTDAQRDVAELPYPGKDTTYGQELELDDTVEYHLDWKGEVVKGEQWITYNNINENPVEYTANASSNITEGKKVDMFTPDNVGAVTDIHVWVLNTPKQYTVSVYNIVEGNEALDTQNNELYYPGKKTDYTFYYNQRFGNIMQDGRQDTSTPHLDNYGLPGVINQEIEAEEELTDVAGDTYTFQYWAYDAKGTEIASTDRIYNNRVTRETELYAIYAKGENEFNTPGLSISKMESDVYTENNVEFIKLNTIINPYAIKNDDEDLSRVAAFYILCNGTVNDDQKNAMYNGLKEYLETNDLDDLSTSGRLKDLTDQIERYIANYVNYEVYHGDKNATDLDDFQVILTNENRIHISTVLPMNSAKGNTMLTIAAMHYKDETIISDNYLEYTFN